MSRGVEFGGLPRAFSPEMNTRCVRHGLRGLHVLVATCAIVACQAGAGRSTMPVTSASNPGSDRGAVVVEEAAVTTAAPGPEPTPAATPDPRAMTDEALGQLIQAASEDTGEFPSDNYVSNETSYLHVAEALSSEALRGRAYVGVGPEQNLTYLALTRPAMAYIVDIRRQNMLEHLVLRAVIERAPTREAFLLGLTSRRPPDDAGGDADDAIEAIFDRVAGLEPRPELQTEGVEAAAALMARLGVPLLEGDRASIEEVVRAFATRGVDLAYSMERSKRRYPTLRELMVARDLGGAQRSFLATEASYAAVRALLRENRVVPVVGDFCGERALKTVARDAAGRGLELGVFYASNVEEYLFKARCYDRFIDNVRAFPADDASLFVRVWFDQGRCHPAQLRGHRTTTVVAPVAASLARWDRGAYRSYWDVVTDRLR